MRTNLYQTAGEIVRDYEELIRPELLAGNLEVGGCVMNLVDRFRMIEWGESSVYQKCRFITGDLLFLVEEKPTERFVKTLIDRLDRNTAELDIILANNEEYKKSRGATK